LALVPGAAALGLEMALGDVVDHAIAGNMVHGVGFLDIAGLLADDDAQLDFPVRLDGIPGNDDIVIGADNGAGGFHKDDRLFGDLGAGFGGMVGIVQPDADELADIGHAGADALAGIEFGQHADIGGADFRQAFGGQRLAADIADDAGEIADGAVLGQDGGLFCALGANAEQFHGSGLPVGFGHGPNR